MCGRAFVSVRRVCVRVLCVCVRVCACVCNTNGKVNPLQLNPKLFNPQHSITWQSALPELIPITNTTAEDPTTNETNNNNNNNNSNPATTKTTSTTTISTPPPPHYTPTPATGLSQTPEQYQQQQQYAGFTEFQVWPSPLRGNSAFSHTFRSGRAAD